MSSDTPVTRKKYTTYVGLRNEGSDNGGVTVLEAEPREFSEIGLKHHRSYIASVMQSREVSVLRLDGPDGGEVFINPQSIAYVSVMPTDE